MDELKRLLDDFEKKKIECKICSKETQLIDYANNIDVWIGDIIKEKEKWWNVRICGKCAKKYGFFNGQEFKSGNQLRFYMKLKNRKKK